MPPALAVQRGPSPLPELLGRVAASFGLSVPHLQGLLGPYMQQAMRGVAAMHAARRLPARTAPVVRGPSGPDVPRPGRAEQLYALVAAQRPADGGGRVLDMAAGPGAVLAAFARHGYAAHAMERNPDQRRQCRERLAAARTAVVFHDVDLCVEPIAGVLFDVIMCNSVIEHAADPAAMIGHLGRMLAPGGVLLLGVANGEAMPNVIADPHHGLFGLTLLPADSAAQLCPILGRAQDRVDLLYDVSGFLPIPRYAALLQKAVGRPVLAPNDDPRGVGAVPDLLHRLAARFAEALPLVDDQALRTTLQRAFAAYLGRVLKAYGAALGDDAAGAGAAAELFREQFIRKFSYFLAVKPFADQAGRGRRGQTAAKSGPAAAG